MQTLAVSAAFALACGAHAQPCTPEWSDKFYAGALAGYTRWIGTFTGQAGDGVVAYGGLVTPPPASLNYFAHWNGQQWSSLGPAPVFAGPAPIQRRDDVRFDPDGSGPIAEALIMGGNFIEIGGEHANFVAQWNGATWLPLGTGMDGAVGALGTLDPDGSGPAPATLFAGGVFSIAGGEPANHIAQWNGFEWSPVGAGLNGSDVVALQEFDEDGPGPLPPRMFAGGSFSAPTPLGLARWNGVEWEAIGAGLSPVVGQPPVASGLRVFDPDGTGPLHRRLYVAGRIRVIVGTSFASGIASWDGANWAKLGNLGTSASPDNRLELYDPDGSGPAQESLYLYGNFDAVDAIPVNRVARWDGTSWSSVGSGLDGWVLDAAVADHDGAGPAQPLLYFAGEFDSAGGTYAQGMAVWDGISWSHVGGAWMPGEGAGLSGSINALGEYAAPGAPAPALYAAGYFKYAGGVPAHNIARWDGEHWHPIGEPGTLEAFSIEALAVFDDDAGGPQPPYLYIGGNLQGATGVPSKGIVRWNGTWSSTGSGVSGASIPQVTAFTSHDRDGPSGAPPVLIAGGRFSTIDGVSAANIAAWNGATWSPLGAGVNNFVYALASFDPDGPGAAEADVVAGGRFTTADGLPASHIARWDGDGWAPLVEGLWNYAYALVTHDEDGSGPGVPVLIVGGAFLGAGNVPAPAVARWDGLSWSPLGEGLSYGGSFAASAESLLSVDEDGPGPALPMLVAGGLFNASGATPMAAIARFNGVSWGTFDEGINGRVDALASFADDPALPTKALYAGGLFDHAGGHSARYIARWGCPPPPPCYPDCNASSSLTIADFACFQTKFVAQDPYADCNSDIAFTIADFACFQTQFVAGCP